MVQRDAGDAVVQVFAEQAVAHVVFQLAVGGGDDAHVHLHRARAAHRPHLAFLQHAQQLDLEGGRGFADFVEEHGAAVGTLEQADVVFHRAGEGAALVAEQFDSSSVSGMAAQFSTTKGPPARGLA
jgi:hypothetical protein